MGHGDEVHLGAGHLVVLGTLLGHGGEGDPVAVVGEVEEGDGGEQQPAAGVQPVLAGAGAGHSLLAHQGAAAARHGVAGNGTIATVASESPGSEIYPNI